MEKHFISAIVLLALILIAGCATEPSPTYIKEHKPYVVGDKDIYIGDLSGLSLINDETVLPPSLPVYVNKYPFGQTGPLFEIDQSKIEQMTENLLRFLNILYKDEDISEYTIEQFPPEISHKMFYDSGTIEVTAGLSSVDITLPKDTLTA